MNITEPSIETALLDRASDAFLGKDHRKDSVFCAPFTYSETNGIITATDADRKTVWQCGINYLTEHFDY